MCDRSKIEVLARELCIVRWGGIIHGSYRLKPTNYTNVRDYTEAHWKNFKKQAKQLLKILDEHK